MTGQRSEAPQSGWNQRRSRGVQAACPSPWHSEARLSPVRRQAAYQAAILETDDAAMSLRIYEALAAIEQRRLSDLEPDSEENRALEDAEQGLLALKAERIELFGTEP